MSGLGVHAFCWLYRCRQQPLVKKKSGTAWPVVSIALCGKAWVFMTAQLPRHMFVQGSVLETLPLLMLLRARCAPQQVQGCLLSSYRQPCVLGRDVCDVMHRSAHTPFQCLCFPLYLHRPLLFQLGPTTDCF